MSKWYGSKILIDGKRREKQQIRPELLQMAGVSSAVQLYEESILSLLKKIRSNRAGAILLGAVDSVSSPFTRVIRIIPPVKELWELGLGALSQQNMPNPNAAPMYENSASAKDDKYKTPGGGEVTGAGTGSSSILEFDPAMSSAYCTLRGITTDDEEAASDNILFHELVHSYRQLTGRWRHDTLGDGYDYVEEMFAVMITNIYMSLEGVPNEKLRGSHSLPFQRLSQIPGQWMTWDMSFYMRYEKQIERFVQDNPELYRPLSNIKDPVATWNPLRQRELDKSGALVQNRPNEGIFGLADMLSH